jgi:hypothetical protein
MEPAGMRQVNRDELIYMIASAIRRWPSSLLRDLKDQRQEVRDRARVTAAASIVDRSLNRFEVLCETPLPPDMGEATFTRPVQRMMGDQVGSGITYETGDE